jgi:hypothetical protein
MPPGQTDGLNETMGGGKPKEEIKKGRQKEAPCRIPAENREQRERKGDT